MARDYFYIVEATWEQAGHDVHAIKWNWGQDDVPRLVAPPRFEAHQFELKVEGYVVARRLCQALNRETDTTNPSNPQREMFYIPVPASELTADQKRAADQNIRDRGAELKREVAAGRRLQECGGPWLMVWRHWKARELHAEVVEAVAEEDAIDRTVKPGSRLADALVAMFQLRALDAKTSRSPADIARKARNASGASFKRVLAEGGHRDLTRSRQGKPGGSWLTVRGRTTASHLIETRQSSKPRSTFI